MLLFHTQIVIIQALQVVTIVDLGTTLTISNVTHILITARMLTR